VLLDDGFLEVTLVSMPDSPKGLSDIVQAVTAQSYSDCNNIIFRTGKKISIHAKEPTYWSLDGEYARSFEYTDIISVPKAIRIIIPGKDE